MQALSSLTTTAQPTLPANYNQPAPASSNSLGKNDFLKLMMTQLQNQDPQNTQDSTQFLAQLAQFSQLEQLTNLNTTAGTESQDMGLASASSLIGRNVNLMDSNGNGISGQVTSVKIVQGAPQLIVTNSSGNSNPYPMTDLVNVY